MNYSPQLNVRSAYNFQESLITINDYLKFAEEHQFKFAFYSDVNTMYGAAEFYAKFSRVGIKPIIGLTIELEDPKAMVQLYAKNQAGFKQLSYLSSDLNSNAFSNQEKLLRTKEALTNDLVVVLSFVDQVDEVFVGQFCDSISLTNLYFGINQNNASHFNQPNLVYTNQINYLNSDDQLAFNVLLKIKENEKVDVNNFDLLDRHYLSDEELTKLTISAQNLQKIVNEIDFDLFANRPQHLMKFKTPNNESQEDFIKSLTTTSLEQYLAKQNLDTDLVAKYHQRLSYELKIIEEMNFINYFLVVWDYVQFAQSQNILVGPGRGSAAGSLVAFLLGITQVDPLQYNLLFERFLNPERKTMPDIDLDFQDDRRDEVIQYLFEKYGTYQIATIVTYQTIGAKNAIRDVFRVFDKNIETVNKVSKLISNEYMLDLLGAVNNSKILKTYYDNNLQAFEIAQKLIGLPRQTGTHAAGVVLSDVDLREIIPIHLGYNQIMQTQFDMNYLEDLGLIKMDLLGLRNLTMLQEIKHAVFQTTNQVVNFSDIPLDDEAVFVQLNEGKTTGIFQLESEGMTDLVTKMQVHSIEDISTASALFRPGPKEMIPTYLKRRFSSKNPEQYILDKSLLPILASTYGIILYQEQVLEVLQTVASFSLGKADIVRRAMSKKNFQQMASVKEEFLEAALNNGYSSTRAQEIWKWIADFAGYGFNKSHSISYAYIAYWLSWFKKYYPEQFYASLFNTYHGNAVRTKLLINELPAYSLNFTGPDIHNINPNYVSYKKRIYAPLTIIKGIGPEFIKRIQSGFLANQSHLQEFFPAMVMLVESGLSRSNFEALVWSGAFDGFNYPRQDLILNLDNIFNFAEVNSNGVKIDLNRVPVLKPATGVDDKLLAEKELEYLGFYLSTNPFAKLRQEQVKKTFSLDDLTTKVGSGPTIINLQKIRQKKDRNGNLMAFVQISDDTQTLNATIFSDLYQQIKEQLTDDVTVIANIKIDSYQNQKRAVINRIEKWLD